MEGMPSKSGASTPSEAPLSDLASALLQALSKGDSSAVAAKLEPLYLFLREKNWKKEPEALLQTWTACFQILELDVEAEVRTMWVGSVCGTLLSCLL